MSWLSVDLRWFSGLWLLVLVSALAVVYSNHLCRQQYAQLSAMERSAQQYQREYRNYLLEQSAWGSLQRIERTATESLAMRIPGAAELVIVRR